MAFLHQRELGSCSDMPLASRPLLLDMRVIFTDVSAGLRDLPSVETEGSAWLLLIRV
jgi:hypothetical protein